MTDDKPIVKALRAVLEDPVIQQFAVRIEEQARADRRPNPLTLVQAAYDSLWHARMQARKASRSPQPAPSITSVFDLGKM